MGGLEVTVLVSIDTRYGELQRYETRGGARRLLTHRIECEAPLPSMPPEIIREFLTNPDLDDYCGPPWVPKPPNPPTGAPSLMAIAA